MTRNGSYSEAGVLVFDSYKDNLILDKYNRVFLKMNKVKLEAFRSEQSEDALIWNIFRTLQKIDAKLWLPPLFESSFAENREDIVDKMKISLWKIISPQNETSPDDKKIEIDVMLENDHFVWMLDVRYKSDARLGGGKRHPIVATIDYGTYYARGKDFYYSLLYLDERYSPQSKELVELYKSNRTKLLEPLSDRKNQVDSIKGISTIKLTDFQTLFRFCEEYVRYEDERYLAKLAKNYLTKKLAQR
ncbi:hypothetical protein [Bacillus rubiinfantis]|uniref:hypothetical protein n=1 Tax=Bacillus rubiinfantis TaxID=1499680 RepID=UPI0005A7CB1E|nr:hypothetical protein [Bacillus rubiinfantis]